jgi:hypothetical protein
MVALTGKGDRVDDHSAFAPFYFSHLVGLFFNGHVLVQDADATFSCEAIASEASVTVSIAADSMGTFSVISFVSLV